MNYKVTVHYVPKALQDTKIPDSVALSAKLESAKAILAELRAQSALPAHSKLRARVEVHEDGSLEVLQNLDDKTLYTLTPESP